MEQNIDNNVLAESIDKPVKERRGRGSRDLSNWGEEYVQPGDNRKFIRHALGHLDLPPIDVADDEAVKERIDWYFNQCVEDDIKPTVMGLANSLGVNRRTLSAWHRGETRSRTHSPLIKKAYDFLEELWEDYMLNGKVNPASGIFLGRNHWGYQDQVNVVVTPSNNLSETMTPEMIEAQLDDIPED